MSIKHKLLIPLFFVAAQCVAPSALAFKVDTHVWIGQQVINDLADGWLSFTTVTDGIVNVPVNAQVRDAILQNPREYLMGNIGPDAFPDIFTGQMVVHPGTKDSWRTDDWLRYLLSTRAQSPGDQPNNAFVQGYMAHAAADVFAHSYVNAYSGNIFDILGDKLKGQSTDDAFVEEERHIELEKFISSYNPPIISYSSGTEQLARLMVNTPSEFVRDRLIFNPEIAERNLRGGALHLAAVYELRRQLTGAYDKELNDMDVLAMKTAVYIVSCYYGSCYEISDSTAQRWSDWAKEFNSYTNAIARGANEEASNYVTAMNEAVTHSSTALYKSYADSIATIVGLNNELFGYQRELGQKLEDIGKTSQNICNSVSSRACKKLPWPLKKQCSTVTTVTCSANQAFNALETAIEEVNGKIENVTGRISSAVKDQEKIVADINTAVFQALEIPNTVVTGMNSLVLNLTRDINLIRGFRDNWIRDINNGMDAYVFTSGEVIKETMKGPDGKPIDKLMDWVHCWLPAVTGSVPSDITQTMCEVEDHIAKINEALDRIDKALTKQMAEAVGLGQQYTQIQKFKEQAHAFAKELAAKVAYEFVERATGVDVKRIMDVIMVAPSDLRLNTIYGTDRSSGRFKGLLEIPDMATRVRAEMHVSSKPFDPIKYNVIRNAVTFAKMSVLSPSELNNLVQQLGMSGSSSYGQVLYNETTSGPANVLVDAIGSIDGNNQWMETAPPMPRRTGFTDNTPAQERSYGYRAQGEKGLRIWGDCRARNAVFRTLFAGPLVPGIESPQSIYMAPISMDYSYKPTPANPFPSMSWSGDCENVGWLIPVFDLLLQ